MSDLINDAFDVARDALLAERARLLGKGWRMTESDWIRVAKIDDLLKEVK